MLILDHVKNTLSHYGKELIPAFVIKDILFKRKQFYRNNFFNLNEKLPARYSGKSLKPIYLYQDIYDYFKIKSDNNPNYTLEDFNTECSPDGYCRTCGVKKDLDYTGRPPIYCSFDCALNDAYRIVGECFEPRVKKVFYKDKTVPLKLYLYNVAHNTNYKYRQALIVRSCTTKNCINPKHMNVSLKKKTNVLPTDQQLSLDTIRIEKDYSYSIEVDQPRIKFDDFLKKISRTYKHEIRCEVTKQIIDVIAQKCLNGHYEDMDKYVKLLTDFDESPVI